RSQGEQARLAARTAFRGKPRPHRGRLPVVGERRTRGDVLTVSVTVLTDPAPGWYRDPAGIAAYRWWDGATWTEGTHRGEPVEPVVVQPAPMQPVRPVRRGASPAKTRWSSLLTAYPVVYPIAIGMITA